MNFLKKNYKILLTIFTCLFVLYVLPNFINLENQKPYIEKKIRETFGFNVSIKGKVSFTILPRPSLVLNRVEIKSIDENNNNVFINASKIFINTGISNFLEKKITINKVGFIDTTFYANTYKSSGYENLDVLLNGKVFKQVSIKNSRIFTGNDFVNDINLIFQTTKDEKIKGSGSFQYKNGSVDNLDLLLSYLDRENYNIVLDFIYSMDRNRMKNDFTYIVKSNEKTFFGTSELSTDNISKLVKIFNPDFDLPTTPFFKEKLKLKSSFQNSNDALLVNNGSIEGNNVVGTFKGKIPFIKNGKFSIDCKDIVFNIDFSNFALDRIFNVKNNIVQNPIETLSSSKSLLKLFQYANFYITAKSIVLNNGMMDNFNLHTSPIFDDDKFNGIEIKKFNYNISNNKFDMNGKIVNILSPNIAFDVNIATDIPFSISTLFKLKLKVSKFISSMYMTSSSLKLDNMKINLAGNDIFGTFGYNKTDKKTVYDANLKSDFVNFDSIFKKAINLQFIISKLSDLDNNSLNIILALKKFKMNGDDYETLKLNAGFSDENLSIKNLIFKNNDYSSQIKGNLVDIVGYNGEFKDFEYKIVSSSLKGLTLPFIRNTFIEKMIANGVNEINILLNGPAENPISQVNANLNNIKVKVNGNLLDGNSKYRLELSHNELKGFLFSWGYIDENLMNYFYDNIPFSVTADIDGDNIKNIDIHIKNNKITGEIISSKLKKEIIKTVVLNSDKLDIKGIIKRIKNTDGYVDLILKMIRILQYNLSIYASVLDDYDGNSYQDFKLDLKNITNPGFIKFNLKKGDYSIDINSEIVNSNAFDGNISIKNFKIPDNLMNNELLNLVSGNLSSDIKFKTFGTTSYQLLSNLSGNYNVNIISGMIKGISNYSVMFNNIMELSNITTNSVIYSIENSLKSGSMDFDNLRIKGKIDDANVENSAFELNARNIDITGMVSGNLIQKSLNIESVFDIKNLSPNSLILIYNLKGYINNLSGKIDSSTLVSKINTVYLQKKKKDL